jgi:hypothetical protein
MEDQEQQYKNLCLRIAKYLSAISTTNFFEIRPTVIRNNYQISMKSKIQNKLNVDSKWYLVYCATSYKLIYERLTKYYIPHFINCGLTKDNMSLEELDIRLSIRGY